MTLRITLPPDAEARLREKAQAAGQDLATFAAVLLHRALTAPSVDELLAPFRREVADSGMSDDELDVFYEDLRDWV